MRTIAALLLCLMLSLGLCACGDAPTATERELTENAGAAAPTAAPAAVLPGGRLREEAPDAGETAETGGRQNEAEAFLDRPLAELTAALGEPLESVYAPSCLGAGEDGELSYEGFTVYTYRDADGETVTGVRGA